jgi:hypothetical protein
MANRYWVGGTGIWNTVLTTNWSTTSGGAAGASAPTLASDVAIFDANSGTGNYTVTLASGVCLTLTITNPAGTGNTLTFAGTDLQIGVTGTSTISSSTGNVVFSNTLIDLGFSFTVSTPSFVSLNCTTLNVRNSGQAVVLSTNACSASCNVTVVNSGGSTTLGSDFTTTGSFQLVTGTTSAQLTITGRTLTCGSYIHNGLLVFGTTGVVNITGTNAQVFNITGSTGAFSGTTNFNLTGSPTTGTRTINTNASSTATANFNINAGSDTVVITTTVRPINLNFTGFSGTLGTTSVISSMTGSLTLSSTMTVPDAANGITFTGTTATVQTITSNGTAFNRPITFSTSGTGGVLLADALTTLRGVTLTQGTLNVNAKTLTCASFASNNVNTRVIAWGVGGKIKTTGTGTVYTTATLTGLTASGSGTVELSGSTATSTTIDTGASTGSQRPSLLVTGNGTYALAMSGSYENVDFSGFAGSITAASVPSIFGSATFSASMVLTSTTNAITFSATSGPKIITSNANPNLNRPFTFDGVSGNWQLADSLTLQPIAARIVTLNNGTLDLNGKTLTAIGFTTGTGTKNLTFNGGILTLTGGTSTAFNNAVPTGFTTTAGTAKGFIYMTSASAKSFVGGTSTYAATLVQAGAGALTLSGNCTLSSIKNTTQPAPIIFTASSTTTFTDDFKLKGTGGSLIVITSTLAGTAATVSKSGSAVSCDYISVKDSTPAGGASWYAGAHSTLVSNYTGTNGWSGRPPPSANTEFLAFL